VYWELPGELAAAAEGESLMRWGAGGYLGGLVIWRQMAKA